MVSCVVFPNLCEKKALKYHIYFIPERLLLKATLYTSMAGEHKLNSRCIPTAQLKITLFHLYYRFFIQMMTDYSVRVKTCLCEAVCYKVTVPMIDGTLKNMSSVY